MTLHDALRDACREVGIIPPPGYVSPGHTRRVPVEGKRPTNRSGAVKVDVTGRAGVATNFVTGQSVRFTDAGARPMTAADRRAEREAAKARAREEAARREEVARICGAMVDAAEQAKHPYLAAKGFPEELGLVIEDPRRVIPGHKLGEAIIRRLPTGPGPYLIVPGWIAKRVSTVQLIDAEGGKKNIYGGAIGGAAHRIATGRETWVCEGIATALSVRAALRLLGRSATVLSAFAANNTAEVASRLTGAVIAADHDTPQDALKGLGAGEYYARKAGGAWIMPPELGDWNDYHAAHGLREVALRLREVRAG